MAKYRVKTDLLQGIDENTVIRPVNHGDIFIGCSGVCDSVEVSKTIIDRNPQWFEEVKEPEFKEGDWVWIYDGKKDAIIKYSNNKRTVGFGFDVGRGRNWTERFNIQNVKSWGYKIRKATPEEIETHLIEEAKRRGFGKGSIANNSNINDRHTKNYKMEPGRSFYYKPDEDELSWANEERYITWPIYRDGTWAEIIEEEPIVIGGAEIDVKEDHLNLSCGDTINLGTFKEFFNLCERYDLFIHRMGEDITKQIHDIADRVK